ncbi:hypothetical protein GC163_17530 [bacterium]|nr:hypothetical protein [bacterium]
MKPRTTYHLWLASLIVVVMTTSGLLGQTGKSKSKSKTSTPSPAAVRQLDQRAKEMQEQLLRDASEISKGYEDAGEYERAKWLLEVLEKLDPKLPGLKENIDRLTDKSLNATEFEFELDVSRGWSAPVGVVQQGRVVRIAAEGDYKLITSLPVTADGLPQNESGADLISGMSLGSVVGMIVDPKEKKPGKPFEIKAQREWTPRESGLLLLKVNLPNGHKSTGKLTIHLGGVSPVVN